MDYPLLLKHNAMSVYNCLQNVIGLAREECPCVDDFTADYAISESGLYVTELQGMSLKILNSLEGCEDLWEKMIRARENAINTFKVDLMQELMKYKEPTRKKFTGEIGGRGFTRVVSSSTYYGLRMFSDVRGGKYILRGISIILNTTEAVNMLIYDEYDLLHTIALTSSAGRPHTTNITPIELPLDRNYYFLISPAGSPYNNKLTCGCGGYQWCFDPSHPCYRRSRDGWTEWAMIGGVKGTDLSVRNDWDICKDGMGIILHGNFVCNAMDAFCTDDSDFINDSVDTAIAWAVIYKTGELLTNYIMDTESVSRYTLLGTGALNENRMYYNARYAIMMDYIAQNWDDDRDDCLKCRPPMGMVKRSQRL